MTIVKTLWSKLRNNEKGLRDIITIKLDEFTFPNNMPDVTTRRKLPASVWPQILRNRRVKHEMSQHQNTRIG